MLILVTPDGELNIYHEKYEFARDDFIAYIGGYMVSFLLCLGFHTAAMIQAFFSLYCLVKNTLPPKVFFKFFKEQNLFFFHKFDGF